MPAPLRHPARPWLAASVLAAGPVLLAATVADRGTPPTRVPAAADTSAVSDTLSTGSVSRLAAAIAARKALFGGEPVPRGAPTERVLEIARRPLPKEKRKLAKTGYEEAYLDWLLHRAYPNDVIDGEAFVRAAAARDRMPTVAIVAGGKTDNKGRGEKGGKTGVVSGAALRAGYSPRWEFVGPRDLTTPYQIYYGPAASATSGRVNGLAFAPSDPSIIYMAAAGGGVWKSSDGGTSWVAVGDGFDFLYTTSVAVHPTNPNIVYVGMGDAHGGQGYGYASGLARSTDGGKTWSRLGTGNFPNVAVSAVVIDPGDPRIVTVTTGSGRFFGGIYRSTNSGDTWQNVAPAAGEWNDIEVGPPAPVTGARQYFAVRSTDYNYSQDIYQGDLWVSDDGGVAGSWREISGWTNVNNFYSDYGVELAASQAVPGNVYLIRQYDRSVRKGVRDGSGNYSFTDITGDLPSALGNSPTYNWSQASYDMHLTCAAVGGQDILYCGLITLAADVGGDGSWTDVGVTYTDTARTHNDQHCLAIDPQNPTHALVGNDGGVYRLTYSGGTTWSFQDTLSRTLGVTQFYHADWHPTDPNRMLGGTQDNATPAAGTSRSDARPNSLLYWDNVGGGDGCGCAINPLNANIQYASAQGQVLYRTTNNWVSDVYTSPNAQFGNGTAVYGDTNFANWNADAKPFIGEMALDPNNPDFLYVGTDKLWRYQRSAGANGTWEGRLGGGTLDSPSTINAIAVAPSDRNRIYVGDESGNLWMSTNRGASFTIIDSGGAANLANRPVTAISVSPTDPADVLVTLSSTNSQTPGFAGHVWRCANTSAGAGRVWQARDGSGGSALPDFPANDITRDPSAPATEWYVASDGGVFYTKDAGATWANMGAPLGLPNVQCNAIKAVSGTGYLNVATFGRGMWRIPLAGVRTVVPAPALSVLRSVTRDAVNNRFLVTVTVQNTGGPAQNVALTQATLRIGTTTTLLPTTTLPVSLGAIGTNGSTQTTLSFPAGSVASNTAAVFTCAGTYTGGAFSLGSRVTLP